VAVAILVVLISYPKLKAARLMPGARVIGIEAVALTAESSPGSMPYQELVERVCEKAIGSSRTKAVGQDFGQTYVVEQLDRSLPRGGIFRRPFPVHGDTVGRSFNVYTFIKRPQLIDHGHYAGWESYAFQVTIFEAHSE
jgi:hypothetical protein